MIRYKEGMNRKGFILGVIFGMLSLTGRAQIDSVAVRLERIKACSEDSVKVAYAGEIPAMLEKTAFGSFRGAAPVKYLGYKCSADAGAELFSWAIPLTKGLAYYNWFRFKDGNRVYLLRTLPGEETEVPPYLFYDLLPFKSGGKEYFVLLGWAQTPNSNRKAVLIARFGTGDKVYFNSKLMRKGKSRSASLTFEYALDGSMMLKHDKKGKRIVFDHLVPFDKKYEGFFMFYGPDGTNDALLLKKGEWLYMDNVKR